MKNMLNWFTSPQRRFLAWLCVSAFLLSSMIFWCWVFSMASKTLAVKKSKSKDYLYTKTSSNDPPTNKYTTILLQDRNDIRGKTYSYIEGNMATNEVKSLLGSYKPIERELFMETAFIGLKFGIMHTQYICDIGFILLGKPNPPNELIQKTDESSLQLLKYKILLENLEQLEQ